MLKHNWEGVYPAVTTKFTSNNKLDFQAFEKNIKAQIKAGVSGIVLGGTLGEASSLTNEEKFQLLETTLKISNGSVDVIVNIAEQTTENAIKLAKDLAKMEQMA